MEFLIVQRKTFSSHTLVLSSWNLTWVTYRSNFNLRSGMADVGAMLDRKIKVSLGTDNSGGFGMGILSAMYVPHTPSFFSRVRD